MIAQEQTVIFQLIMSLAKIDMRLQSPDTKPSQGSCFVEIQPLIFSHSPAVFDEQIAFTLQAYRGVDWETLRREKRPSYGNPSREAETAEEA